MVHKYYVTWYSGDGSHKAWGVYRKDDEYSRDLICVCKFKKGAENVAVELNNLYARSKCCE